MNVDMISIPSPDPSHTTDNRPSGWGCLDGVNRGRGRSSNHRRPELPDPNATPNIPPFGRGSMGPVYPSPIEELRDRKKELFEMALQLAARVHPVDPKALRELREE